MCLLVFCSLIIFYAVQRFVAAFSAQYLSFAVKNGHELSISPEGTQRQSESFLSVIRVTPCQSKALIRMAAFFPSK